MTVEDVAHRDTEAFAEHRDHLFAVAYRMLGSVAEAEDVVQEAYLRWSASDRADIESPVAYLTTVATRLSIDRLRSAEAVRVSYVGPWLPEPLVADVDADDPADAAELADSLTTAFLVLLERLNPVERAVVLLHDVFGYGFDEVAEVVDRPASSCRQLASRARGRLTADHRARQRVDPAEEQRLVGAFQLAAVLGDVDALIEVLADDVVLWSDGGANRHAARRPVVGPYRVSRLVVNLAARLTPDMVIRPVRVNGDPGIVVHRPDGPFMTLALEPGAGGIRRIHVVINPDKLRHLDVDQSRGAPHVSRP